MTPEIDQRNPQPTTRRRPVLSPDPVGGAATERPRFPKFAAAMAAARAANAPQLMLEHDLPSQPMVDRDLPSQPMVDRDLPSQPMLEHDLPSQPMVERDLPSQPMVDRDLPSQLGVRDLPEHDIAPAASRVLPQARAAQWRAPRRAVAPWFGIASCVVLFGVVLALVPMPPIGAEIERLIGPWLEWRQDPEVAAPPQSDQTPAMPEPAARRDEPQSGSMPVLADAGSGGAAGPASDAPVSRVATPEEPAPRSVPVPTLKPLTDR